VSRVVVPCDYNIDLPHSRNESVVDSPGAGELHATSCRYRVITIAITGYYVHRRHGHKLLQLVLGHVGGDGVVVAAVVRFHHRGGSSSQGQEASGKYGHCDQNLYQGEPPLGLKGRNPNNSTPWSKGSEPHWAIFELFFLHHDPCL